MRFQQSYLIRNLQPGGVYQVEVRARNSYGWSPVSRIHTFFTRPGGEEEGGGGGRPTLTLFVFLFQSLPGAPCLPVKPGLRAR